MHNVARNTLVIQVAHLGINLDVDNQYWRNG